MGFYCVTLASNFGVHLNNLWVFYKRLCQNHSFWWASKNTSLLSDNDFSIERKQEFNELLKCAHLLSIDLMLQEEPYLNISLGSKSSSIYKYKSSLFYVCNGAENKALHSKELLSLLLFLLFWLFWGATTQLSNKYKWRLILHCYFFVVVVLRIPGTTTGIRKYLIFF